jgi:hypothetical protein
MGIIKSEGELQMEQSLEYLLFASAHASAKFAQQCLEPYNGHLRAISSFVNPQKEIMHWHEFGDLEGPGWAANAIGGAHLLFNWGKFCRDDMMVEQSKLLLLHVLNDGFVVPGEGFVWPYYDLNKQRLCWNYTHGLDWLCPGSIAKMGVQLLDFAADINDDLIAERMTTVAINLSGWLFEKVQLLDNGWLPRRITPQGDPYPFTPDGRIDPIFDHSGDGLFLLQLWSILASRGHQQYIDSALKLGESFIASGGFFGSINHDTYDSHESVAYACAFRILCQAADLLGVTHWKDFAFNHVLPGLNQFRILEDVHGLPTKGLIWMEESWNTAYLWENAEVSQAYLEAWTVTGNEEYLKSGLEILEAVVYHHHGEFGFLTEGVDWDNHVGQQHHIDGKLYEDIQYTEPLLNNLHFLIPTLFYFSKTQTQCPQIDTDSAIRLVSELTLNSRRTRE